MVFGFLAKMHWNSNLEDSLYSRFKANWEDETRQQSSNEGHSNGVVLLTKYDVSCSFRFERFSNYHDVGWQAIGEPGETPALHWFNEGEARDSGPERTQASYHT